MVPFLCKARPGWLVQQPVIGSLNQPPRLRPLRRLRGILLMGAATPPWPRRGVLFSCGFAALCLLLSNNAFAQSGNASVGGFVQDATQAFIPGVTITATNTQTGVTTTAITNESGAYNIPSLLPGTYKLTAELAGFRTQVVNDVQLGQSATARYNFTLQVGAVADSGEVTAESTALIAETSSTIGQVLAEKQVRDLPLVSNNVLDLMQTMPGIRGATLGESTTFAGVSTGMVNTVRDGL